MKTYLKKLTILGILAFGLFFVASDSSVSSAASASCSQCSQMADTCRIEYAEGEPGYKWCMRRVENCFRLCNN